MPAIKELAADATLARSLAATPRSPGKLPRESVEELRHRMSTLSKKIPRGAPYKRTPHKTSTQSSPAPQLLRTQPHTPCLASSTELDVDEMREVIGEAERMPSRPPNDQRLLLKCREALQEALDLARRDTRCDAASSLRRCVAKLGGTGEIGMAGPPLLLYI